MLIISAHTFLKVGFYLNSSEILKSLKKAQKNSIQEEPHLKLGKCEILPREGLWPQDSQTKLFSTRLSKYPHHRPGRVNLACLLFFLQCRLRDMTYSAPITVDIEYTRGSQVSRVLYFLTVISDRGFINVFRRRATCFHRWTNFFFFST